MRILYVDIDSLRPDHLGCYGYPRPTSPVIDELSRRSAVFNNCHASDAPCLPSRAALFSGRLGIRNGVVAHNGPASQLRYAGNTHWHDPEQPMWMRQLQQLGWETVCFSGFPQRHLAWWFGAGFTQNFSNQLPGGPESAQEVNARVLPWLSAHGASDNWFLHVNYWDVHTPYHAPEELWRRFEELPPAPWPDPHQLAADHARYYGPRTARDWWSSEGWRNPMTDTTRRMPRSNLDTFDDYLGFVNGYDAGVANVDARLGEILEELARLGILEDTAVIVSSDHGEAIAELGMYFDHGNCAEGTTHVPLVIRWPGVTDGGIAIDGLAYQLDLPATVCDLLGQPVPPRWDGISRVAEVAGKTSVSPRDHLILGGGAYSYQRAVRTPTHRLVRTLHPGLLPYDPVYLFDMVGDPHQTHNLAAAQPQVLASLDHLLLEWWMSHVTGRDPVRDPFLEQLQAGYSPEVYCSEASLVARLEALGRIDQVSDLQRRRDALVR